MKLIPLTDPDRVTAQLRLLEIHQKQRRVVGFGNTNSADILEEAQITIRLSEA